MLFLSPIGISVVDLLQGQTSRSMEARKAALPATANGWMPDLTAAVCHLHGRDIVHRDLKWDNVILEGTTIKLIDFGHSEFLPCLHKLSVVTPLYSAPELYTDHAPRDYKSADVFSLGVCAFALATGFHPFTQDELSAASVSLSCEKRLARFPLAETFLSTVRACLSYDSTLRPIASALLWSDWTAAGAPTGINAALAPSSVHKAKRRRVKAPRAVPNVAPARLGRSSSAPSGAKRDC